MYREEWKPIIAKGIDYTGLYEVSNAGRVRSLDRIVVDSIGRRRFFKGKILELRLCNDGYLNIGLHKNGKVKDHIVHRLLAEAFIPNPDSEHLTDIDHIRGGDKLCNFVTSIEWVTKSENSKRSFKRDGRKSPSVGKKVVLMFDKQDNFLKEFDGVREASRQTGVNRNSISACCNRKQKTAGNHIFRFREIKE